MEIVSRLKEAKDGAAALVFVAVVMMHIVLAILESSMKRQTLSRQEAELTKNIKAILKEANLLSSPATFAKSAKLRRAAAQKEKELAELRQKTNHRADWRSSALSHLPTLLKAGFYAYVLWWFWQTPVATVPYQLMRPFEKMISSKNPSRSPISDSDSGLGQGDVVMVGVIPWLILCSRVGTFLSKRMQRKR